MKSLLVRARVSLAEAAEARLLTCDEVRVELGQVAEGLARTTAPVRRHLKACDRCRTFRGELRKTSRALAAVYPIGPLVLLKKLWVAKAGVGGAGAAGAAASGGAAGGSGMAGVAVTAAGGITAGGAVSAGVSTLASKAAAGMAAAVIVTAGAVEVKHVSERQAPRRPAGRGRSGARAGAPTAARRGAPGGDAGAPARAQGRGGARSRPCRRAGAARGRVPLPPRPWNRRPPAPVQEEGSTVTRAAARGGARRAHHPARRAGRPGARSRRTTARARPSPRRPRRRRASPAAPSNPPPPPPPAGSLIDFDDFMKVDIRVGRVARVEDFPEARKPAWKLFIDFGPELGEKRSSAQIKNYSREELEGSLVVAVVNFPPRQIGPFMSEVLTLGVPDEDGNVILLRPTADVPVGGRMF